MSNTECDRVNCVHNKMCNYLFELFDAQFTKVIDCNSYEEGRPQGEWIITGEEQGAVGITYKIRKCNKCGWEHSLVIPNNFCPNCGADMRGEENG